MELEAQRRALNPGAGDDDSRRRGAFATTLIFSFICLFLSFCLVYRIPFCFIWLLGGRISRRTAWQRRELQLSTAPFPATSREGSLAAGLLWSSMSTPDELLSGCLRTSHAVDSVQAPQLLLELRFQLTTLISPSSVKSEFHKPPGVAPPHFTSTRSQRATSSKPCFCGNYSPDPFLKVMLSPLKLTPVDQITCLPKSRFLEGKTSQILKIFSDWVVLSKISSGFIGISSQYLISYFSFGMYLPVDSSGLVLLRSFPFSKEKTLPPYSLPMARDVSSDSLPSVCFSFLIDLSSCVAVSTGPEDAIEITSVVLVDEVWTPTSPYVTILQFFDFVGKANPTHSSFVSNPLSSSIEDLSCFSYLHYLYAIVYAYCQKGWIIPSTYCIVED